MVRTVRSLNPGDVYSCMAMMLLSLPPGPYPCLTPQNPMKPKHQTPLRNGKQPGFREDTSLLRLASGRGLSRQITLWGHTFVRMGRAVRSLNTGHVCSCMAIMLLSIPPGPCPCPRTKLPCRMPNIEQEMDRYTHTNRDRADK